MTNHTPTPWKILDHDDDYIAITDDFQEEGICEVKGARNRDTMKANAAFIVRAVNAHEEMLEALKFIKNLISERGELPAAWRTAAYAIEQAIAKAEGQLSC